MARLSARFVAAFAELRRRRVFRLAAGYAVGVWILLQIADVLFPALGLTEFHLRALVVAALLLFPLVLFLGWRYDLTVEGLVRTRPAAGGQLVLQRSDYGIFAVLTLLTVSAGYGVFTRILPETDSAAAPRDQPPSVPVIAVLPMLNLSDNPDNEYFADGLTEELLNVLARLKGLKVIGRTSSFAFKGKSEDLTKIGQALNATHLLEGSVRQSGDRLRITAQLVEVDGGNYLWSDSFDEMLGDVFAIQSSIAQSVVDQLRVPLLESNAIKINNARNFEAFDRYLAGKANVRARTLESIRKGVLLFREAISLDSGFAPAYASLATALVRLHVNYGEFSFDEAFGEAESAVQSALTLDPESAEAHAALAVIRQWTWQLSGRKELDRDAADQAYRTAIARNPNDADSNRFYANFLTNINQPRAAIEFAQRALEIDRIAPNANSFLAAMYEQFSEFVLAEKYYRQEIKVNRNSPRGYHGMASLSATAMGDLAQAVEWVNQAIAVSPSSDNLVLARLLLDLGADSAATAIFDEHRNHQSESPWVELLFLGDYAGAQQMLIARLNSQSTPTRNHFRFAGRASAFAGDYDRAAELLIMSDPRLMTDDISIGVSNLEDAVCLAYSLQYLNRDAEADRILAALLDYFERRPRLGTQGYGFADARVHALLGDTEMAVTVFEQAVAAGVRSTWFVERWPRPERDPILSVLHDHPRFQAAIEVMRADLEAQRRSVNR